MIADPAAKPGLRLCCSRTAKSVFSRQGPLYYTADHGSIEQIKRHFLMAWLTYDISQQEIIRKGVYDLNCSRH